MDFIKLFIYTFYPAISDNSAKSLNNILRLKTLTKGEQLNSENSFFILKAGSIKAIYFDEKEKAYTTNLFLPSIKSNRVTNVLNFPASNRNFECITNVELYECSLNDFNKLTNNNHEISILSTKILEHKVIINGERASNMIKFDTEKRYINLLNEFPYLEKLIPKYEIAAYLNISPVQLTRIRKKIRKG